MLKECARVIIGCITRSIIHTPGHTPGGISLFIADYAGFKSGIEGILFTGDTIFAGSIGRTDLPYGSYEEIIESITNKILPLGDNIKLLPGHGPETTIGREKKFNKFLTDIK